MTDIIYTPVLKWKSGEKIALQNLNHIQKSKIKPVIILTDYIDPQNVLFDLDKYWGNEVFIDTFYVDEGEMSYLKELANAFKSNNKPFNPVVSMSAIPYITNDLLCLFKEIVVKIPVPEEMDDDFNHDTIFTFLKDWAKNNLLALSVLLDLSIIKNKSDANSHFRDIKNILNDYLLGKDFYNKIIVCASSFPSDLSSIERGKDAFFDRLDIKLFNKILQEFENIKTKLVFADYGVARFTETEIDFTLLRHGVLPKARYTTEDSYWVLKGEKDHFTKRWIKSFVDIAKEIENSKYYFGEGFSFGDKEIKERANGLKGPGNNTNWITIGTNHHIAVVVEQLSKIHGI